MEPELSSENTMFGLAPVFVTSKGRWLGWAWVAPGQLHITSADSRSDAIRRGRCARACVEIRVMVGFRDACRTGADTVGVPRRPAMLREPAVNRHARRDGLQGRRDVEL